MLKNSKEFYLKELGYFADGYDKDNNIWYEWDEKEHFNYDGTLKQKDILRQKEIEEFLKCHFIRIKEFGLKEKRKYVFKNKK